MSLSRAAGRLAVVALVGLFAGCDAAPLASVAEVEDTPPLMPLAVGNRWVMQTSFNGSPSGTDSLRVTSRLDIDGTTWYHVESSAGVLKGLLQSRSDGIVRAPSQRIYPLDLAEGERLDTPTGYVEVLERNAQIALPDGRVVEGIRFAEWTTQADLGDGTMRPVRPSQPAEMVFAFGIGPVHLECSFAGLNARGDSLVVVGRLRMDLVRFTLAP